MFVVDAHEDIAYNALCFNRDYRHSALKKRRAELNTPTPQFNGEATLGLPEAIAGRVALTFATIFVAPEQATGDSASWTGVSYKDSEEAHRQGLRQLEVYRRLNEEDERLRLVRNESDLDAVLHTWDQGRDVRERVQGLVLLMENADPIREPAEFEMWYEHGVRIVGPAWRASRYTAGTGAPGSLTTLGHALLDVMSDYNAVLDLSHMAERAFYEALDTYDGIVIASHSNPRRFCDTDRHLSDDMIRRLAERDGVMGIVMANHFLHDGWQKGDGKWRVTLNTVLDAIEHVCQVTGSAAHVGLGSDFDGGFGAEGIPYEFDTIADLWRVQDGLRERGFEDNDIRAVLGGNMLRKLRPALKGA